MKTRSSNNWLILIVILSITAATASFFLLKQNMGLFNRQRAYRDIEYQMSLGPRVPGSDAHAEVTRYISGVLAKNGWKVELQIGTVDDRPLTNIIAKRGAGDDLVILGTHYDCRIFSDEDPLDQNRYMAVPGANDGASGVAVLLELGRILPEDLGKEVWLVFFDLEDQGRIADHDWIEGSRYFVQNLDAEPRAVVIVDMVGDENLNIYQEANSSRDLTNQIWSSASSLGYEKHFVPEMKYSILDDHFPFLEKGVTAALIIDFDYPYWHTSADTLDKISSNSLKIVGDTLYNWLVEK